MSESPSPVAPGATFGEESPDAPPEVAAIAHANGLLRLTADALMLELTRGPGYRGTLSIPRARARVRVMGRAIAVLDRDRLVQLCSRCKPRSEVQALVDDLGPAASVEPRTPFATLLDLAAQSAAYRPAQAAERTQPDEPASPTATPELPAGVEVRRRAYGSRGAMEQDGRRMRAAGWVPRDEFLGESARPSPEASREDEPELAPDPEPIRGWRRFLHAASPNREFEDLAIVWVRPRS
ncbi:MAG: hypothetical protein WAM30_01220 [Candidatus Dormiibacterota bacterium]